MTARFLNQDELAVRWRISPRTLERWRWQKTGPSYYKFGGKVFYAIGDIEEFERRQRSDICLPIVGTWR